MRRIPSSLALVDVDQHHRAGQARRFAFPEKGREPAERSADQNGWGGERGLHPLEIGDEEIDEVRAGGRPIALSVTAPVERDGVIAGAPHGRGGVTPGMPRLSSAVHQDDRRAAGIAIGVADQGDSLFATKGDARQSPCRRARGGRNGFGCSH